MSKINKYIPYQVCPVCNATGQTLADGFISSVYETCTICQGNKIIPMSILSTEDTESIKLSKYKYYILIGIIVILLTNLLLIFIMDIIHEKTPNFVLVTNAVSLLIIMLAIVMNLIEDI